MNIIIALASTSAVKQAAVTNAQNKYRVYDTLRAVKARSSVPEQPVGDETDTGAKNRALDAAELVPEAWLAIAIESGIFKRRFLWWTWWVDLAVVVGYLPQTGEYITVKSRAVHFPKQAVEEALKEGGTLTVGKVMAKKGIVAQHDDPHLSLTGKSRSLYLEKAVLRLFKQLRKRGLL